MVLVKLIFKAVKRYGFLNSLKVFYLNICRKKQFFLNLSFIELNSLTLIDFIPKLFSPVFTINNNKIIRTVLSFRANVISEDPFVNLVEEINQKNINDFRFSSIKNFYEEYKIDTIYELYPLTKQVRNSKIFSLKAKYINYILPWDEIFYKKKLKEILSEVDQQKNILRKSEEYNFSFNKKIFYGNQNFGPVNEEMGKIEFKRYKSVLDSIKKFGYKPDFKNNPHVSGHILKKGNQWIVLIADGVHRATVLLALGYKKLPVSFKVLPKVIKTQDVSSWPAVARGIYSEEEALIIFDSIFYGNNFLKINYEKKNYL